jgi:hypothetical protein
LKSSLEIRAVNRDLAAGGGALTLEGARRTLLLNLRFRSLITIGMRKDDRKFVLNIGKKWQICRKLLKGVDILVNGINEKDVMKVE